MARVVGTSEAPTGVRIKAIQDPGDAVILNLQGTLFTALVHATHHDTATTWGLGSEVHFRSGELTTPIYFFLEKGAHTAGTLSGVRVGAAAVT